MPTVTAAITTHNRADLVREAVASALAQTYDDIEVIVVDNGSTDGTREALAQFAERIRYLPQDNRGRAGARNRAIAEARGRYIAFLDSDDRWKPDKLAREVAVLDRDPAVALVHGHVDVIDADGSTLEDTTRMYRRLFQRANRRASYASYALESRCFTSTVMARTAVLRDIGGYDIDVELEDVDLYLRIALDHAIEFLDESPVAEYRIHAGQTGNEELTRGYIQVCEKHLALLGTFGARSDASVAARNFHLQLARCHHLLAEGRAARRDVLTAMRLDPMGAVIAAPQSLRWLVLSFAPRAALRAARARRVAGGAAS